MTGPVPRLLALALLAACTGGDGHPPVARASASPETIPENDEFQTAVTLDGTTSADPIDDPDGVEALDYRWQIWGDEFQLDQGDETDATPVVRFRGDRPATVELTVTDADGLTGRASFQMRLTLGP
ncbi:MAG TPA: hypothetical protein VL172_02165 [Kofleriaceae bacterium]|jgi:hypothetical protein|nr:hypothetical protein [Kofleriaceae bacterium]